MLRHPFWQIEQDNWLQNCQKLEEDFRQVIGPAAAIEKFCKAIGQKWLKGIQSFRRCFGQRDDNKTSFQPVFLNLTLTVCLA